MLVFVYLCLCICLSPCICHCICLFYLYYDFHDIFPELPQGSTAVKQCILHSQTAIFFHQDRGGGPIVLCINNPFVSSAPTSFSPYGQCDREPRALMVWNSFQTWMARTRHRAHLPNNKISWSIFSNYLVISIKQCISSAYSPKRIYLENFFKWFEIN